jgi:catechol 2,3-dioxygenase-like lactoylglutathione lyase family enzyme
MSIQRMDHVGVVVGDPEAATAFFVELGLELEGEAAIDGRWVDPKASSSRWPSSSAEAELAEHFLPPE